MFADVSFFDIAGQKNYYRVHAQNVWIPDFSYFGVDTVVYADFLLSINDFYFDEGNDGKEIKSVETLREKLRDLKEGDSVKLTYERSGKTQTSEVKFPKKLKTADL